MADIPLVLQWGNLADGYAPASWQDFISQLEKIVTGYLPGEYKPVNYGSSTPAVEDQDRPWVRTNPDGTPDKTYVFYNGKWVNLHPVPASGNERRLWVGSEANLRSYDGGDGTADVPTSTTGAMWEVDTNFAARFPVGVGSFAASGDVAVTGTSTSTAISGEDKHTLLEAEMPAHTHNLTLYGGDGANNSTDKINTTDETDVMNAAFPTTSAGSGTAHNNLPPFYGVYFIKRTARIYNTPDDA